MAMVDFFLELDGIEGETTDKEMSKKKAIELDSFSVGAQQAGTQAYGSGGGAGKVRFQPFHLTKKIDKASPKLLLACASGQHFPKATITCRKAGGNQEPFLIYHMKDVLISSFQTGGHGHAEVLPTDQLSLDFGEVIMEYGVQDEKGKVTNKLKAGWNLKQNTKAE
jgi:type VI secretion system secreted protein Hcp